MALQRFCISNQSGFSLLEILVAMLVMAVGTCGLGLLLLGSVQGTAQAGERSMAALQASELAQLIHANPAVLGHFTHGNDSQAGCGDELPCSGGNWAADHLAQWQQELESSIALARGTVCKDSTALDGNLSDLACDGLGNAVVKVAWQEAGKGQRLPQDQLLVLPLPRP
ncbi:MAG TPA: type IV pilus modification protein PilV [Xanthomonadales bacterium]|nr:type IV pilus modification protein PilV [Xanthomonadales bacterium]